MAKARLKAGDRVGQWALVRVRASGGNAIVWDARGSNDEQVVVKVLKPEHRRYRDRVGRFRDEIAFHQLYGDIDGVLPVFEAHLPDDVDEPAWLVMPVAIPLVAALGDDPPFETVLDAVASFAETLGDLARRAIGHRDIKPDNLFAFEDRWVVGDFGLATYPEKEPRTDHGRRLGPLEFMAPEMRSDADSAPPEPADVYSLAKVLWVLMTGRDLPLPGPHRLDDPAYSLRVLTDYGRSVELDRLMEGATRHEPSERMTLAYFAAELRACLLAAPEVRPDATEAEVVARIEALTAPGKRAEEESAAFGELVESTWERVKSGLDAAYYRIREQLPGFRATYNDRGGGAFFLLPQPRAMHSQHGSTAVLIEQGQSLPVTLTVAAGVRIEEDGQTATVVAAIRLQGIRGASAELTDLYTYVAEAPIGSARLANEIDKVTVDLMGAIPSALRAVAEELPRSADSRAEPQ